MYLDFYHLKSAPFHSTPDPTFLFLSPSHKAALGAIVYGIEARQGVVLITGDIGVGKTTMLRAYLQRVDLQQLTTIYLWNAHLSGVELLTMLFRAFDRKLETDTPAEMVTQLQQCLLQEYHQGRNVALIIDEAQHLPLETLEYIRWLSNLETAREKLVQIVLVGQPELQQTLHRRALRSLAQRIVIRATIVPLTPAESLAYIRHRIAKVVLPGGPLFTPGALQRIVRHAQGRPRVLNIVCTNALIAGYGVQQQPITAGLVTQVIGAYAGTRPFPWGRLGLAASAGLLLMASLLWFTPLRQMALAPRARHTPASPAVPETPAERPRINPHPGVPAAATPTVPPPAPLAAARSRQETGATVPVTAAITAQEVQQFVEAWLTASRQGQIATLVSLYEEQVQYYGRGLVSKRVVAREKQRAAPDWARVSPTVEGEIAMAPTTARQTLRVTFVLRFAARRDPATPGRMRIVQQRLTVQKVHNRLRILGETQQQLRSAPQTSALSHRSG